jgi:hypothetical protein
MDNYKINEDDLLVMRAKTGTALDVYKLGQKYEEWIDRINFGRQSFKLAREFSGGTLINRVNIALQRWVADGFTQAILERIRVVVFALAAPGP